MIPAPRRSRLSRAVFSTFAVAALSFAFAVRIASANTISVTSTADNGAGTLRQALTDAVEGDTIDATGISGTILLTTGELLVDKSVTILGPGADKLAVDGNGTGRVFHITNAVSVSITSLTIRNGSVPTGATSTFPANAGGGIYNDNSTLTISNCTLTANLANSGGGIFNDGLTSGPAALTVKLSTISNNVAEEGAGGISNYGSGGTLMVTSSTISGNSVNDRNLGYGGAIASTGGASITNSTLSGNSAETAGGIGISTGGGIAGTLEIGNTILKAGSAGANLRRECADCIITSRGFNLSSDDGAGVLTATGDQINTDPKLGPLGNNGGPTQTHSLLSGSPAIDQGERDTIPALATETDQRGFSRTNDDPTIANAVLGDGTDIGAVELQPAPTATADLLMGLGTDKLSVKQGDKLTYTVTVRNLGPDAAPNVSVNDVLSSGTTFVSAQVNKGSFTAPPVGQTGTVTWTVGTMANGDVQGAQIHVTIIVNGKATSSITNTATVGSAATDPNSANNTASIATPVANGSGGKKQ